MTTKACAHCRARFESSHKTHLYCSNRCRWEKYRETLEADARDERKKALDGDAHAWGKLGTREVARESLRRSLAWDRGWWGVPMVQRWADTHGLTLEAASALLVELWQLREARSRVGLGGVQWRAA